MFNHFQKEKSDFLNKKDKSKKGSIDKDIVPLVKLINSKNDYYTTSSCAGRIVLLEMKSRRKDECNWLLSKHDKVNFRETNDALKKYKKIKNNSQIWFKQQPLILHVACRSLDAAKKFLDAARKIFKHSGIIGLKEDKITIEVIGSDRLETIIADKNFVANESYLRQLVKYANSNFVENKKKSEKFLKYLKNS